MGKKRKIRAPFRKNRGDRPRRGDWRRRVDQEEIEADELPPEERISGKGELARRRTVVVHEGRQTEESPWPIELAVDESRCRRGRVLSVHGLLCRVESDGEVYQCAVRRLLKSLATDQRHVVAVGDRVLFRPAEGSELREGIIERIEPRRGSLCRNIRGRRQVIVTNVDQVLIVTSAAEPRLKPNLIDRMLVAAEKAGIYPVICINKVDLVERTSLVPLMGVYSQMGYQVLLLSAETGFGIERLRRLLAGRQSVVAGQSGVGKSSLLNAVDPQLSLPVAEVSVETQKGRHTTSTAQLLPLAGGGYVVDTPGIRQFELWDVIPEEVAGFYRDLRPYVSYCRFPDCTHTHETDCAVKSAVADGRVDERRYESYRHLVSDGKA
ncbi:MAG TPA: ribosome small subunit-dependent GTPase A [Planctomycetaceae bacterium]|nr:ribosome small subunit-dependent GTPase A [Planctomycetaceae bacterium]